MSEDEKKEIIQNTYAPIININIGHGGHYTISTDKPVQIEVTVNLDKEILKYMEVIEKAKDVIVNDELRKEKGRINKQEYRKKNNPLYNLKVANSSSSSKDTNNIEDEE